MADQDIDNSVLEFFEVFFEQNVMGMALRAVDPYKPRWLRVNQKLCDMLGYTREELLQLTSVEISMPEERNESIELSKQILNGDFRSYSREKRYLRKDGSVIWTNIWLSVVTDRDNNPKQIISVIQDISDQKKSEIALMESEARFRAVLDNSPFCLNLKDTEGRYLFVNKGYEEYWGHSAERLIGKKAHEHQSDVIRLETAAVSEQMVLETGTTYECEVTVKCPRDDQMHDRLLIKFPVKLPDGSVMGIGTFAVDITDRKRAEEELVCHRDHLQELVDQATGDLKAKAEELRQALAKEKELNELQRRFVSMASHEFRTPLAMIDATAQRMKSQADKNRLTPDDAIQRVGKIRAAVQRMTLLMESTLDAARMEEGKISIKIVPCDIGKVMSEVCARQQEIALVHVITYEGADLPETIQADTGALEQVFTNLLSNAVKYAPDAPNIEVKTRREGHQVVISVRDHGIGIDTEDLHRIGERFFRAKTSTGIVGTGIGLNLVRTLVEMHGGTMFLDSKKGEGSTFTVLLPIAGPVQSDQPEASVA
jgi:PAS domain S-box-containing protein